MRRSANSGRRATPPRTSSTKAKRLPDHEREAICQHEFASNSPNGRWLAAYLLATTVTGCRPSEWPTVQFRRSKLPGFTWEMVINCGKNSNNRAHGPTRTLRWVFLPDHVVEAILAWLAQVRRVARTGRYDALLDTLGALMARITKKLFSRRKQRPTLYSARHEAAARWKAHHGRGATTKWRSGWQPWPSSPH
jgi:integrase